MAFLSHEKYVYDDTVDFLHIEHVFDDDCVAVLDIGFLSPVYIDLQKDIFKEYFELLVERIGDNLSEKHIQRTVEELLQELNAKLVLFADKLDKVDYFSIKGSLRVFAGTFLTGSLIGDTSMVIIRDSALYYAVSNDYDNVERIDLFSEFLEGELDSDDEILVMGYDLHTVFDKHELKKFNDVFSLQNTDTVQFLEEIMSMRMDISLVSFLLKSTIVLSTSASGSVHVANNQMKGRKKTLQNIIPSRGQRDWSASYFPLVVAFLGLVVVGLGFSLFGGLRNREALTLITTDGEEIDVSIQGIRDDIALFDKLDPTSDEKSHMYRQLIEQIDFLESQDMRPQDVDTLRSTIERSYQQGFNIVYETSLDNFADEVNGVQSSVIDFVESEKALIGSPRTILVNAGTINVLGTRGGILDIIDSDRRGTTVDYGFEDNESVEICSLNILRNGAYCSTNNGLYNITKAGVEPLSIDTGELFSSNVSDLGIFGRTNFYVLSRSLFDNQRDVYVTRYRNVVGSQSQFTNPTDYPLLASSGTAVDPQSMTIDGNFLVRDNGAVHQRRRDGNTLNLSDRIVAMRGGDTDANFSDRVHILTHINTDYIILFDQENQTVSVYDTVGVKTNDAFTTSYNMRYVMKFVFNLSQPIVSLALDETTANAPIAYALTQDGVYKLNIIDFIDEILNQ